MERDGVAGAATTAALDHAIRPASAGGGDVIEIDKARQVLFVVRDGKVSWVLNASTGSDEAYQINGRTEMADTPEGHWQVAWVHDGLDVGELGGLCRPRYSTRTGSPSTATTTCPPTPPPMAASG